MGLGDFYRTSAKFSKAITLFRDLAAKKNGSLNKREMAKCLTRLAETYLNMGAGHVAEVEPLCKQALALNVPEWATQNRRGWLVYSIMVRLETARNGSKNQRHTSVGFSLPCDIPLVNEYPL